MGLREVKKELTKLDDKQLINHISTLYKNFKEVREYFDFYFNPNEKVLLEEYKDRVYEGFFPSKGYEIKLSIARKAINDFKKLNPSVKGQIDLLLYFVESGVDTTLTYGDMWEAFYESLENTYSKALKTARENGLLRGVKKRANKIHKNTQDLGWGFGDMIGDIYYEYYPD